MYANGNSFSGSPALLGASGGTAVGDGTGLPSVPPWKLGLRPSDDRRGL